LKFDCVFDCDWDWDCDCNLGYVSFICGYSGSGIAELFNDELLNIPERDKRVSVDKDCCLEYFIVLLLVAVNFYNVTSNKYMWYQLLYYISR